MNLKKFIIQLVNLVIVYIITAWALSLLFDVKFLDVLMNAPGLALGLFQEYAVKDPYMLFFYFCIGLFLCLILGVFNFVFVIYTCLLTLMKIFITEIKRLFFKKKLGGVLLHINILSKFIYKRDSKMN